MSEFKTLTDGTTHVVLFKGRDDWKSVATFDDDTEAARYIATERRKDAYAELVRAMGPTLYNLGGKDALALHPSDIAELRADFEHLASALLEEHITNEAAAAAYDAKGDRWDAVLNIPAEPEPAVA